MNNIPTWSAVSMYNISNDMNLHTHGTPLGDIYHTRDIYCCIVRDGIHLEISHVSECRQTKRM